MRVDGEKLYTLAEARRELYLKECRRRGHRWQVTEDGEQIPTDLKCLRCGEAYRVSK